MLYVAYGSNMVQEQMDRRCPSNQYICPARILHHRVGFCGHSVSWGGAVATILPVRGEHAKAVLYELDEYDLKRLDAYEGAPTTYRRIRVAVRTPNGRCVTASTYSHSRPGALAAPSRKYLSAITKCYIEHGWRLDAGIEEAWRIAS